MDTLICPICDQRISRLTNMAVVPDHAADDGVRCEGSGEKRPKPAPRFPSAREAKRSPEAAAELQAELASRTIACDCGAKLVRGRRSPPPATMPPHQDARSGKPCSASGKVLIPSLATPPVDERFDNDEL